MCLNVSKCVYSQVQAKFRRLVDLLLGHVYASISLKNTKRQAGQKPNPAIHSRTVNEHPIKTKIKRYQD